MTENTTVVSSQTDYVRVLINIGRTPTKRHKLKVDKWCNGHPSVLYGRHSEWGTPYTHQLKADEWLSEGNWLEVELDRVAAEVASWPSHKQDMMRAALKGNQQYGSARGI